MDLDNLSHFKQLDPQDMLAYIDGLPDQLQTAWELSQTQPFEGLEPSKGSLRQIVICGMGGSAIGADLVSAAVMDTCSVPIIVNRDYGLPAFAKGPETLVICSSHSGNTEETLTSFETALQNGCRVLAISTGWKALRKGPGGWHPGLAVRSQGPAALGSRLFVWTHSGRTEQARAGP